MAETVELAARLKFDLRSDLGYRYPGSEDEEALGKLAELCWAQLAGALPGGRTRTRRRRMRGSSRSCR